MELDEVLIDWLCTYTTYIPVYYKWLFTRIFVLLCGGSISSDRSHRSSVFFFWRPLPPLRLDLLLNDRSTFVCCCCLCFSEPFFFLWVTTTLALGFDVRVFCAVRGAYSFLLLAALLSPYLPTLRLGPHQFVSVFVLSYPAALPPPYFLPSPPLSSTFSPLLSDVVVNLSPLLFSSIL